MGCPHTNNREAALKMDSDELMRIYTAHTSEERFKHRDQYVKNEKFHSEWNVVTAWKTIVRRELHRRGLL